MEKQYKHKGKNMTTSSLRTYVSFLMVKQFKFGTVANPFLKNKILGNAPKGYSGFSSSFDKSIRMMGGKRHILPFF
jgi:hypothetical protein